MSSLRNIHLRLEDVGQLEDMFGEQLTEGLRCIK